MKENEEHNEELRQLEASIEELQGVIDAEDEFIKTDNGSAIIVRNKQTAMQLADEVRKTREIMENSSFGEDFEYVQTNLRVLISQANCALTDLIALAKVSDHPRAYEVLGSYITLIAGINKQVLGMHQIKQDFKSGEPEEKDAPVAGIKNQQNVQNNIVFNGSPADLLKFLNNNKDK